MSGHSKWSSIKHKKGSADSQRGRAFSKITRQISVAARLGGSDPDSNPGLRSAIIRAREVNMPKDNIERAIKKATGELGGSGFEELIYEGYGPHGVAILIDVMTDNKNRTTAEIRYILSKMGGNLGESGCVSWIFEKKGLITINEKETGEDELLMLALDAGADDVKRVEETYEVTCESDKLEDLLHVVKDRGIKYDFAEVTHIPKTTVCIEDQKAASKILKLVDRLEEHDDIQNVAANFDIPEEILNQIG